MPYYEVTVTAKATTIVGAANEQDAAFMAGDNLRNTGDYEIDSADVKEIKKPVDWEDQEERE